MANMHGKSILLINKYYHDHDNAGGVGRYVLQEAEDLAASGWQVIPFAMADKHARPTPWESYFIEARDYSKPRLTPRSARDALALLWNREAARKIDDLVRATRPSVAHIHNIYHHITPSILPVLARHGVPAILTLHDLRLLCPAIHMLRDGRACEACRGGRYWKALRFRCVKNSRPATILAVIETQLQHSRALYKRHVRHFLCPSKYYLDKYAEWGFPRRKLIHLPNYVDTDYWRPTDAEAENCYLYFGRIAPEKGLATLLRAHAIWERDRKRGHPPPTLLLAGSGDHLEELERLKSDLGIDNARFLGYLDRDKMRDVLNRVRFSVLPSVHHDNAPLAVLESMAAGKPVAASRSGGLPELIADGSDGVIFDPGSPETVKEGLERADRLGPAAARNAREKAVREWARGHHIGRLESILAETAVGSGSLARESC